MSGKLKSLHVLIAEDEPLIGLAIDDLLTRAGACPHWVRTDREAYAALEGRRAFDLLIVDINLREGTTGFDVARFARRHAPRIAVIYVSGSMPNAAIPFGVEGSAFVSKPFTEAGLLETIERLTRAQPPVAQTVRIAS